MALIYRKCIKCGKRDGPWEFRAIPSAKPHCSAIKAERRLGIMPCNGTLVTILRQKQLTLTAYAVANVLSTSEYSKTVSQDKDLEQTADINALKRRMAKCGKEWGLVGLSGKEYLKHQRKYIELMTKKLCGGWVWRGMPEL